MRPVSAMTRARHRARGRQGFARRAGLRPPLTPETSGGPGRAAWGAVIRGRTTAGGHRTSSGQRPDVAYRRRTYRRPRSAERRKCFRTYVPSSSVSPFNVNPGNSQQFISPACRPRSDSGAWEANAGRGIACPVRCPSRPYGGRRNANPGRPWVNRVRTLYRES